MARSAPSLRQASHFPAEPAVVITLAPSALANWIAAVPIPDEPPCTSSVSPDLRPPRSKVLYQTVKNVSGTAAASVIGRLAGTGRQWLSCAGQYSAWPPPTT